MQGIEWKVLTWEKICTVHIFDEGIAYKQCKKTINNNNNKIPQLLENELKQKTGKISERTLHLMKYIHGFSIICY